MLRDSSQSHHGQQILVSSSTAALLSDALDGATALRELGAYRLKDLSQPERTFQVLAEGLRSEFPALTSLDSRPNNLPSQISTSSAVRASSIT